MALIINNRAGVEGFSQGGIYMECLAISSGSFGAYDPIPAGTPIYIAPALWDQEHRSKWQIDNGNGTDPVWEFEYQLAPGTYSANLINQDPKSVSYTHLTLPTSDLV